MSDHPSTRTLYYDALKVSQDAPVEVIRAAYRSLSQKYHPDRNAGDESAHVMAALNQAYEVLSHPAKKREYDAWIRQESLRVSAKDAPEHEQKQPLARRARRLRKAVTRKRVVVSLSVLTCCAAVVFYSTSQTTDPWLERAWHESWRSDVPSTTAEPSTLLRYGGAGAVAEPVSTAPPALKWENTLKNSAAEPGRDVRF